MTKRNSGFAPKKKRMKRVQKKTKTIKMRWRSSNRECSIGVHFILCMVIKKQNKTKIKLKTTI
ncbi:MAG: hypothetical protein A3F46_00130 [Legionellales bacterium RIFCSPHIGHO2_12_FULL_42_9]|nr:MAG: hypothetical protein A3F46_00130 [Legionellales bacterium RIFCSPHIGHO2_12_FULL_42_9]